MLKSLIEQDICQTRSWYTPKFSAVAQETETGVGGQPWVTKREILSVKEDRQSGMEEERKEKRGEDAMVSERTHEHPS